MISDSNLEKYLRTIGHEPLLTAEEERELGWRIINDRDEMARRRLIEANLRLVVCIGKRYVRHGLTLEDIVEEGNIGLIRAVDKFDPAQGTRFSTYAAWWIKQALGRKLDDLIDNVRIPWYMRDVMSKCRVTSRRMRERSGCKPTIQELADELGLPLRVVTVAVRSIEFTQTAGISDEDRSEITERIADEQGHNPHLQVEENDERVALKEMLDSLDARKARVLRMRFGFEGRPPLTLKEIGRQIGLTRERVRQIETDALSDLHRRLRPDEFESRMLTAKMIQRQAV
ncbi:MAG TPA: RNA polymerase sigma factor RpoD/SigA [Phycisphaerales bacterium]|nr:RNA polymerase sigma factor RpoD/SigA [Phycisphaerales bacterium]